MNPDSSKMLVFADVAIYALFVRKAVIAEIPTSYFIQSIYCLIPYNLSYSCTDTIIAVNQNFSASLTRLLGPPSNWAKFFRPKSNELTHWPLILSLDLTKSWWADHWNNCYFPKCLSNYKYPCSLWPRHKTHCFLGWENNIRWSLSQPNTVNYQRK